MLKKIKGQSILEYVIILTAIVAAVLIGAGYIKDKVDKGLSDASTAIDTASTKLGAISP